MFFPARFRKSRIASPLPQAGRHVSLIQAEFGKEGLCPDDSQWLAMHRLARLADEVVTADRRFRQAATPRGVFLWGGVGRGKTCLVDALARAMNPDMVRRYHQHVFLEAFHRQVSIEPGAASRFDDAVRALIGPARLLVLDEFHAYDIADALILKRALSLLDQTGVALVLTANHRPWHLWPDTPGHAQQARHFDPLAEFLRERCDFIEVDTARDYRLLEAARGLSRWFEDTPGSRLSLGAAGQYPATYVHFWKICGGLYRHADYAQLCGECRHLYLVGLPRFGAADGDALRRLVWLVDAAWEAGLPMTVTAETAPEALFEAIGVALETLLGKDLRRTSSRLAALVAR